MQTIELQGCPPQHTSLSSHVHFRPKLYQTRIPLYHYAFLFSEVVYCSVSLTYTCPLKKSFICLPKSLTIYFSCDLSHFEYIIYQMFDVNFGNYIPPCSPHTLVNVHRIPTDGIQPSEELWVLIICQTNNKSI